MALARIRNHYEEERKESMPELALVAAVIIRAIRDIRGGSTQEEPRDTVQAEAREWLMSESCRPMTFVWCCDQLGFDPAQIRAKISQ